MWKTDIFLHVQRNWKEKSFLNPTCGEDEHVSPPGPGNILGMLVGDYKTTKQFIKNTNNEITKRGLRPSHVFCNQVKSDISFLSPPEIKKKVKKGQPTIEDDTKYGLHVNEDALNKYRDMIIQRLNVGRTPQCLEMNFATVNDNKYQQINNGETKQQFAELIKGNVKTFLEELCKEWNSISIPSGKFSNYYTGYNMFILRFIWRSCMEIVNANPQEYGQNWVKIGGAAQGSSSGVREIELNNIDEILSNVLQVTWSGALDNDNHFTLFYEPILDEKDDFKQNTTYQQLPAETPIHDNNFYSTPQHEIDNPYTNQNLELGHIMIEGTRRSLRLHEIDKYFGINKIGSEEIFKQTPQGVNKGDDYSFSHRIWGEIYIVSNTDQGGWMKILIDNNTGTIIHTKPMVQIIQNGTVNLYEEEDEELSVMNPADAEAEAKEEMETNYTNQIKTPINNYHDDDEEYNANSNSNYPSFYVGRRNSSNKRSKNTIKQRNKLVRKKDGVEEKRERGRKKERELDRINRRETKNKYFYEKRKTGGGNQKNHKSKRNKTKNRKKKSKSKRKTKK